jgi:hypothetical protein
VPWPFPEPGVEIGGPVGGLGGVVTGGAATGGAVTGGVAGSCAGVELGGPPGVTSGWLAFVPPSPPALPPGASVGGVHGD